MKNQINATVTGVHESGKPKKEIQSGFDVNNSAKNEFQQRLEKDLNTKILEVTMKIRYHYPELSKYLDEIPIKIPTGKDREITLKHLKEYYESLSSILNKYQLEYPKIAG